MHAAHVLSLWAMLFVPYVLSGESKTIKIVNSPDARVEALRGFFRSIHSPLAPLAADFVQAADHNGLDWRLLPSIAMVESSGGIHYKNRNIFGWGSGHTKFRSIRSSIHYVASRLSRSRLYAGKDVLAVLRTYNPVRPEYPYRVLRVMGRLPADSLLFARMPSSNAPVREAGYRPGYQRGHWSAGPAAVPSRRAMLVEAPTRAS
jgi:hypothetical protein